MTIDKYVKAPAERKRYVIDYTQWLDTGELVSAVVFVVSPVSPGAPLVIDGIGITPSGMQVQYYASGGVLGQTYKVVAKMTTFAGQVREDALLFTIREV